MTPEEAEEYLRARRDPGYGRLGDALLQHYGAVERWYGERVGLQQRIADLEHELERTRAAAAAEVARVRAETAVKLARKDAVLADRKRALRTLVADIEAELRRPERLDGAPNAPTIPAMRPSPQRRTA